MKKQFVRLTLFFNLGQENANGFEMDLQSGKDYYFLQNTFAGWKRKSRLSRNSKELVIYELDGASYSEVRDGDSQSK